MKRYCLDTSAFSNPMEAMPEDIYERLWSELCERVEAGVFATTAEVYSELTHLMGNVGNCVQVHKDKLLLEIGNDSWDWETYLQTYREAYPKYEPFISGTGGSKVSLSVPDFSIVIMAKTIRLPVVSMESPCAHQVGTRKRKIPDVCAAEGVRHMTFNDLLRAEGIKL
jgi:hypothetical protein